MLGLSSPHQITRSPKMDIGDALEWEQEEMTASRIAPKWLVKGRRSPKRE